MNTGLTLGGLLLGGVAVFLGQFSANAVPGEGKHDGDGGVAGGPDVIVGAIPDTASYPPGTFNGEQFAAYAFGSTSCNVGVAQLQWQQLPSNLHPVIPQNMYRIKNGAIEQIGMSWVKHGFCALQENLCGTCVPAGAGCPSVLGIGCSDPYTASLNGSPSDLKSRGPINPSLGWFNGNYPDPTPPSLLPTSLRERVAVRRSDLDPAQNAGAIYLAECQYIHPQDAAAENDNNNASYRLVTIGSTWSTNSGYPLTLTGATIQQVPALHGWKTAHPDVQVNSLDFIGDGRFLVGSRAIDNGNGTWRYEYAVFNLNSHRGGGSFSVPVPQGVAITNIGFKSPTYLNGEGYTNAAWNSVVSGGKITWTCEPNTNINANALRWSTLYNFRFTANVPPASAPGLATIGLWRQTTPSSTEISGNVAAYIPSTPTITGDLNGDGVVDSGDLGVLLSAWGTAAGDLTGDATTDSADLGVLLANWTP